MAATIGPQANPAGVTAQELLTERLVEAFGSGLERRFIDAVVATYLERWGDSGDALRAVERLATEALTCRVHAVASGGQRS